MRAQKVFRMTPEVTEALADFCNTGTLMAHSQALDEAEDIVLNNTFDADAPQNIGVVISLRETRKLLLKLISAMTEVEEEEDDE